MNHTQRLTITIRVVWPVAACSLLIGMSTVGCGRPKAAAPQNGNGAAGVAVSVAKAERRTIIKQLDVTGSLVAQNDVMVGARTGGKLASVHVREGDQVAAGQIVAAMDAVDFQAQIESAQANVAAALTRQAQAEALAEQARNQQSQAETNLDLTDKSTAAGLAVARAALASAEQSLAVVRSGARPQEREQAAQQVQAAKANLDKLRSDLKRMEELQRDGAISPSQLDQVRAAHDAAEAAYRVAQEGLSLIKEGARREDVRRAELAVEQAQEGLKKAQADRALVDVRRTDVANARVAAESARKGVEAAAQATRQARAALTLAKNALNNAYVRSPVAGFVAARLAEPGQQVGGGSPILRIVAPGSVYFQAALPESQYAEVRTGQTVEVTVDAVPGARYAGRVSKVLPVASSAARSFTLRVDFQGNGRLRPQMFARGKIIVGTHVGATVIPKSAVIFGGASGDDSVFVVGTDNKAAKRTVKIGYSDPASVEVLSGLQVGAEVIVAGQNALQDGDPITIR